MTRALASCIFASTIFVAACSSDSTTKTNDLATSTHDLAMKTADLAMSQPVGFQTVEDCAVADYDDQTAATAPIAVTPWNPSLGKKCIKVSAGATVTWSASSEHPLEATTGTTPTPIPTTAATSAQSITFSAVGVYGYQCQVHTSLMHGAIWVVQ